MLSHITNTYPDPYDPKKLIKPDFFQTTLLNIIELGRRQNILPHSSIEVTRSKGTTVAIALAAAYIEQVPCSSLTILIPSPQQARDLITKIEYFLGKPPTRIRVLPLNHSFTADENIDLIIIDRQKKDLFYNDTRYMFNTLDLYST